MRPLDKFDIQVRAAIAGDSSAISDVILTTLRTSNAKDYKPEIIARVESSFSVAAVKVLIDKRVVFVATKRSLVVGTASLDGRAVRSVFVLPDMQHRGVGRSLTAAVEAAAKHAGIDLLAVPSSVTAEQFYNRLGYRAVREVFHNDERTIVMEREL